MDDWQWIEGAISVEAVLSARSRDVSKILIRQDRYDATVARIQRLAQNLGITCERMTGEVLAEHNPSDKPATVLAFVGPRYTQGLDELLSVENAVIVMLDGVEDPFNFGQAVRSLYAAGIDGLALRPRNWLSAAATVIRASAGATEFMPTTVINIEEALPELAARGIPVGVATTENARPMDQVDLSGPLFLVIGGEKRGVARPVMDAAAVRVRIPYGQEFRPALGTAGAAAVLGFEILRQRHNRR